jgi:hypothetical protein
MNKSSRGQFYGMFKNEFKLEPYLLYPRSPKGEGGILFYLCPSFRPFKIFFVAFFSVTWWQKSDIWSQASYRYTILWVAFLDPSDSYFLFADFVDFYTYIEHICSFFSATIDGRNLIFGHKLHIGTPYREKRFLIRQIPTSCLPKSGGIIGEH